MAITLNDKSSKIGFKFAENTSSDAINKTDTMVIVSDGKLMFNKERLGLTAAEANYLTSAINEKLLKKAIITLQASPSTYEYVPGTPKPTITFTLTLKVDGSAQAIVNSSGTEQNQIAILVQKANNTAATIYLTLNNNNNSYTKTITMNGTKDTDNTITNFVTGNYSVTDDVYCKITSNGNDYVLALTKPFAYVNQGGLIYAGCVDASLPNADFVPNDNKILGVSTFNNYVNSNKKGDMSLNIGTNNTGVFEAISTNAHVKLSCLNLVTTVSDVTITLTKPSSATSYYGVVALPTNINLGKFAKASSDGEYKAINTITSMESPFKLLVTTNFETCTGTDNNIGSKKLSYMVFRTKNALKDSITIKL